MTARRARLAVVLLSAAASAPLLATRGYEGDMLYFKAWSRRVTLTGIASAYARSDDLDVDYPPVILHFHALVGHAYRLLADPGFDSERALASQALTRGIKLIGVGFHLLTVAAVFRAVAAEAQTRSATLAAGAYALNPAVLYDVAGWGQPDSVHAFLLAAALALLARGRPGAAGLAAGLALLTKPQAWALVPLLALGVLRSGARASLRLGAGAALGALLPCLPFLAAGRTHELLALPHRIYWAMPFVNAGAHNFWWLVTLGENVERLPVHQQVLGPLSFRAVAALLVAAAVAFSAWLLTRRPAAALPLAGAWLAFAWYTVSVQAHENHSFLVLPLLALVLHRSAWIRIVFASVSMSLLVDMLLHSPGVWGPGHDHLFLTGAAWWASMANAGVNLALLAFWTFRLARGDDGGVAA